MEYDFTYVNPTRIHFGKKSLYKLEEELSYYGKNVLLTYGSGSIKKNGIYQDVISVLNQCQKNVIEFSDIMPNPTYSKVKEGISIARDNHIDFILAVGGGSVIDCSKAIAIGMHGEDIWDKYWNKHLPLESQPTPIGVVLTMVGTGSEMDGGSVITNEELGIKTSIDYLEIYPRFSILNPEYTFTLSHYQMISGIMDIMSHIMEIYFSESDHDNLSDDLAESVLRNVIRNTRKALLNKNDYVARSNIMWDATVTLNGILKCSKKQDWQVHAIEHQIAVFTDCAHGMGLAAIQIAYYRYIYKYAIDKFKRFAVNVWNVDPYNKSDEDIALEGIFCLEQFQIECGAPINLKELGLTDSSILKDIAESCLTGSLGYKPLNKKEILEVLEKSFGD